jgi:hypothetical protein
LPIGKKWRGGEELGEANCESQRAAMHSRSLNVNGKPREVCLGCSKSVLALGDHGGIVLLSVRSHKNPPTVSKCPAHSSALSAVSFLICAEGERQYTHHHTTSATDAHCKSDRVEARCSVWVGGERGAAHPPPLQHPTSKRSVTHTHLLSVSRRHIWAQHRGEPTSMRSTQAGLAFTARQVDMWLAIRGSRASWWSSWQRRRHSTTQQRTRVAFCVKKQLSRTTNLCTTFALCAAHPPTHPHNTKLPAVKAWP